MPETIAAIIEIFVCSLKLISFVNRALCTIVNELIINPSPKTFTIGLSCGSSKKPLIAPAEKKRIK